MKTRDSEKKIELIVHVKYYRVSVTHCGAHNEPQYPLAPSADSTPGDWIYMHVVQCRALELAQKSVEMVEEAKADAVNKVFSEITVRMDIKG